MGGDCSRSRRQAPARREATGSAHTIDRTQEEIRWAFDGTPAARGGRTRRGTRIQGRATATAAAAAAEPAVQSLPGASRAGRSRTAPACAGAGDIGRHDSVGAVTGAVASAAAAGCTAHVASHVPNQPSSQTAGSLFSLPTGEGERGGTDTAAAGADPATACPHLAEVGFWSFRPARQRSHPAPRGVGDRC